MKIVFRTLIIIMLCLTGFSSNAEKPINEWGRQEILQFFQDNDIIFEGEYHARSTNNWIMIGNMNEDNHHATMNFYVEDGKFVKALITTSEKGLFDLIQQRIENQGFDKVSESKDKIGNQYSKFESDRLLVTIINKRADWPELYFQP
jgi:hypothetical protein